MKNLVVSGVLGLAAVSAYFIFQSQGDAAPEVIVPDKAPALSQSDVRAKITRVDEIRNVQADEAQTALKQIGLWEPGDTVSWESRDGKNGNYKFTNFSVTQDGDQMQAENLEISGLRLIDGDKAYYDGISATELNIAMLSEDTVITVDAVGMKMPDGETVKDSLPTINKDEPRSPMDYLLDMMEPGQLPALPEAYVENVRIVKQAQVNSFKPSTQDSGEIVDSIVELDSMSHGPYSIKVEEVTTLGFAALSKIDGTNEYSLQASNFSGESHSYYKGTKRQTQFVSLQVAGFDDDVMKRFEPSVHHVGKGGSDMFSPMVQSVNIQGFKTETDTDLVQLSQGSLWHSDTRADQFTRKIDVPNLLIASKPQFQSNEEKHNWSDNPFAEFGYDNVNISISSQTAFDKQARTVTEDETRVTASEAFDVSVSYKFSGLDAMQSLFMMGRGAGNQADAPKIGYLNVAFTDRGIIDRVHEKLAEEQGQTIEDVKATTKAASLAMKMGAQTDYQRELMQSAIDAYGAIIDTGGKFQMRVQPQRPIDMGEFGKVFKNSPRKPDSEDGAQDYEKSMQMDALDALIREMNISFEHYIAD